MVDWSAERFGIDSIAFGTDFYDGWPVENITWWRAGRWARQSPLNIPSTFSEWPDWFRSPADFPGVLQGLRDKGFTDEDVAKIAGGNWLRLFRESFGSQA